MTRSERRRLAHASIHGRVPAPRGVGRPFLGIRFDCCGIYSRVYRNRERDAYEGRCPGCLRRLRIRIDPEGTAGRFFQAW